MSELLQSILAILAAFLPFTVPAILLLPVRSATNLASWGARLMVINLTAWIVVTSLAAAIGIPIIWGIGSLFAVMAVGAIVKRRESFTIERWWYGLAIITLLMIGFGLFARPLLLFHQGLPTGDAQKAILWAQDIITTNHLPDYSTSLTRLNRDPVDFYTPGLHAVVAALMIISPLPLLTISFFSICAALAVALVAAAMSKDLFDTESRFFPASLVVLLVLTNIRFLRYLREPGYHLQNSVGEILLFALLMIGLSLIHRWRNKEAILFGAVAVALLITHQFSSFIAMFMLVPIVGMFLFTRSHVYTTALRQKPLVLLSTVAAFIALIGSGFLLELDQKIPHIFTSTPHLLAEVPDVFEYPRLLGLFTILAGLGGGLVLIGSIWKKHPHYREAAAFIGSTIVVLALSQGPRLFIDIPPVRALLYSVVPLSICAAYFITKIVEYLRIQKTVAGNICIALVLLVPTVSSITMTRAAFASRSHDVRTNSTLKLEQLQAIETLKNSAAQKAIIIDDYNDRAAAWFTLTNRPVFSRLASEGTRQLAESKQSALRQGLYIKQLDFEKIYSLGNWPGIMTLLNKHTIADIVAVNHSSAPSFIHNPLLQVTAWGDKDIIFTSRDTSGVVPEAISSNIASWLLRTTTIANDIGDNEDTFAHLAASLEATRISEPQFNGQYTYRATTAPLFTLSFNVDNYIWPLWDKDGDNKPDTALDLLVVFTDIPQQISLTLSSLPPIPLTNLSSTIRLEAHQVHKEADGTIKLIINNPTTQPVNIDMIALGQAQVP